MSTSWLDEARQRAQQNACEGQNNPEIIRNLRERDQADERRKRTSERPVPAYVDEIAPKVAPRRASHAARPMRANYRARPATLEEMRDDALTHEYVWTGIERTMPDSVRRRFA